MRKPIPGEKHHWFPKVLAKAWAGDDGLLARTNSRGHTKRRHPAAFGYTPDHHNILSEGGSPWDTTFESDFDKADKAFPQVIAWLEGLRNAHLTGTRAKGVRLDNLARDPLAECLASLIVRSPRLRYLSEKHTAEYQVQHFGFPESRNLHQTAGANLRRLQEPFARDIRTGGKFGFLIADEGSFVFGDGFMSNINARPDRMHSPMALVPVTPQVAVLWFSPISYPSFPEGVSLLLTGEEVSRFNEIVQIYACDYLFHVGEPPELHEAFKERQHYIVCTNGSNHRTPVVDGWINEVLEVWEYG